MEISEAYSLLGISSGDRMEDVRRKYHRLMNRHHPDVLPDNEDSKTAQKINEAFALIKREGISSKLQITEWGIEENPRAFCKRKLYMEDSFFGKELVIDTGGYGRYYWEPDMESFPMLLKSVGEAANSLLPESARAVKAKLLHLLLQEFIDAFRCLEILYPHVENDTLIQTFQIKCQIKADDSLVNGHIPLEQIQIQPQDSKLLMYHKGTTMGQIMFEEDWLYYLITPLFFQNAAKADLFEEKRGMRQAHDFVSATMCMHVDPSRKQDPTEKINAEIKRVLKRRRED